MLVVWFLGGASVVFVFESPLARPFQHHSLGVEELGCVWYVGGDSFFVGLVMFFIARLAQRCSWWDSKPEGWCAWGRVPPW